MKQSKVFVTSVLALIGILLIAGIAFYSKNDSLTSSTGNTAGTQGPAPADPLGPQSPAALYRNGLYTAKGNYVSPGGTQSVSVTLVLKDDMVLDMNINPGAVDKTSEQFQAKFISGIKEAVIGKKIDDLDISVVSGSSLTSGGFNEAIEKIKTQARI